MSTKDESSILTFKRADLGRTLSWYAELSCANHSKQGALTTRTATDLSASALCTASATETSEPVAMITTSAAVGESLRI